MRQKESTIVDEKFPQACSILLTLMQDVLFAKDILLAINELFTWSLTES